MTYTETYEEHLSFFEDDEADAIETWLTDHGHAPWGYPHWKVWSWALRNPNTPWSAK